MVDTGARSLLTMADIEAEWGFPVNTQRFWRHKGIGPKGFRCGRRVVFDRAEIEHWIEAQRRSA